MKTSVIRYRVADFLRRYAPFDSMEEQDLLDLAGSGRVKFHEAEEYVFQQGQPKGSLVWIIQQGRVELLDGPPGEERLRDVMCEGDLLGLAHFAGRSSYRYSARTATDVILYALDLSLFEVLASRHPILNHYLAAHFSMSGALGTDRTSWLDAGTPPLDFLKARLSVISPSPTVAQAASCLVTAKNGVVAIVDGDGQSIGIVTAADICAAASGQEFVTRTPPPAITARYSIRDAVREMLRTRSEILALTADGKPESPLDAILTASDLALFCGRNPAALLREIRSTASIAELRPLVQQSTSLVRDALAHSRDVDDCAQMGAEVISALADIGMYMARQEMLSSGLKPPDPSACWLAVGNLARGEMLIPRLPNLAVIYDDSDAAPDIRVNFAAVAKGTLTWLRELAIDGSEPSTICMSISEWRQFYSETIRTPLGHDLFERREFFDLRLQSGEASLFEQLNQHVAQELGNHDVMVRLLANDTLSHLPPLTFFRGIVLDLDGGQRNSLDLAATAVHPISDAARVFALARRGMSCTGTLERLEAAAFDFPEHQRVFQEAAEAFRVALYHLTLAESPLIDPSTLARYDQRLLKTAFASILRLLELTASTFVTVP